MAYLQTLEGDSRGATVEDLFNCNDALGVVIYGPGAWNKIKAFVADLATGELIKARGVGGMLSKITGKQFVCNHDILDDVYGFDHELGCELLGGEEWGAFVNAVKSVPTLGSWFSDIDLKHLVNPATIVQDIVDYSLPRGYDPLSIAKYLTGIGQIELTAQQFRDISGLTAQRIREQNEKELKRKAEEEARLKDYTDRMDALESERIEAQKEYEKAKAEAEAAAAAQVQIQTSPEYIQSKTQTRNLLILGGLGLGAIYLLAGRK